MKKLYHKVMEFLDHTARDHVGAYAAQSAFFMMLSLIPLLLMLLTLVQYTPLTKGDVMTVIETVFPSSRNQATAIDIWMISLVNEVYNQSKAVVPVTAVVAFWSAGRGVLAITTGLNCIYDIQETRNYIFLRIRAAFYTLIFVVSIVFSLLLLVFGNTISIFVNAHFPILQHVTEFLIGIRSILALCVLVFFFVLIYRFLPNHRNRMFRMKFRKQLPGALFTAVGWLVLSFVFSIYVDVFKGFTNMYGSLATIILLMLWLYFIMYVILLGGEINIILEEKSES